MSVSLLPPFVCTASPLRRLHPDRSSKFCLLRLFLSRRPYATGLGPKGLSYGLYKAGVRANTRLYRWLYDGGSASPLFWCYFLRLNDRAVAAMV